MRKRTRTHGRTERGASAVEFALVVIPLLMIIGGIVNFGFVFAQQLALDNAVRAGARAGVVDTGNDPALITQAEWDRSAIAKTQTSGFAVSYVGATTCEDSDFGDSLIVRGTVKSTYIIPWPLPGVPQFVNLSSQAEFQCEYE